MTPDRVDSPVGPLRSLLARLVNPSEDWARRGKERRPSALMVYMAVLLIIFVACAVLSTRLAYRSGGPEPSLIVIWILLGTGAAIVVLLAYQIRRHLLHPLANLYNWALSMCDGDLSARISPQQHGQFAKLTFHINRLSEALEKLANEMDDIVWQQTKRLHQRNKSLEILYEVASTINTASNLDELLTHSAQTLVPMMNAEDCVVRLRTADGEVRAVVAGGNPLDDRALQDVEFLLLDRDRMEQRVDVRACRRNGNELSLVSVPIHYQGKNLGLLSFTTAAPDAAEDSDLQKLLMSVGKHLGMAVATARLDEESRNLTLMRERTSLAHELHDSLAQSLASLRFQVKLLSETLDNDGPHEAKRELRRVINGFDGLHTELRELIANFRAPMDERGLLPALEDLVARFGRSSGISTHFHTECGQLKLPAAAEMQILGIVREALANARKHSNAQTVRLLLRCETDGSYTLLVEDDGIGAAAACAGADLPGEHVGLEIMEERAKRLGGELRLESEPGEGTRVELRFDVQPKQEGHDARASAR